MEVIIIDNKAIGLRIEQRRKHLGLTLEFVAKEIGVAKSTVQRYEKGTIEKIKLPVIEAIARVLDVNPAWICCKSNTMTCYSSLDTPVPPALENVNANNSEQIDPDEKHLLSLYRELNEEGREKLVDYADDMVRSGKYKKNYPIQLANG